MQNICYNSVMNRVRRQLMRPSATALLLAVDSPFFSAAYSVHGQLTNEVQNGVSLVRFYDSLNRPTGYSLMHDAQCTMHNGGGANPSTFQPFNRHLLLRHFRPLRLRFRAGRDALRRVRRTGRDALRRVRQPFNFSTTFTYAYDHLGVDSPKLGGSFLSLLIHKNTRRHLSNKELGVGCMKCVSSD